jgi:hypothetical protein
MVEEEAEFLLISEIPITYLANQKQEGTPRRALLLQF